MAAAQCDGVHAAALDDLSALSRRHPTADLWRAYAAALALDADARLPPG